MSSDASALARIDSPGFLGLHRMERKSETVAVTLPAACKNC
jgi:hypothetical protein